MPGARYRDGVAYVRPAPFGGHNWQPMSFNPMTGLVYIPAQDNALAWRHNPGWSFTGRGIQAGARTTLNLPGHTFPDDGHLIAWDPVAQRAVWQVDYDNYWNGGTQYVAVMAGWGGAFARGTRNEGKIFAFALGAEAFGAETTGGGGAGVPERPAPEPIELSVEPDVLVRGNYLFDTWCARCHGGGTTLPDLRYSDPEVFEQYPAIVLRGARAERGMPPFADELDVDDVRAIAAWIVAQRNELGG